LNWKTAPEDWPKWARRWVRRASALRVAVAGSFDGKAIAHFLFQDGNAARNALEAAGITVLADREVLVQRLNQGQPGQLGKIARAMAEAGVNIEVQYSDHDNQLILVVDDIEKGRVVSENWKRDTSNKIFSVPIKT
jgi:hypothetical protein